VAPVTPTPPRRGASAAGLERGEDRPAPGRRSGGAAGRGNLPARPIRTGRRSPASRAQCSWPAGAPRVRIALPATRQAEAVAHRVGRARRADLEQSTADGAASLFRGSAGQSSTLSIEPAGSAERADRPWP
jgi:hypothetical protein